MLGHTWVGDVVWRLCVIVSNEQNVLQSNNAVRKQIVLIKLNKPVRFQWGFI